MDIIKIFNSIRDIPFKIPLTFKDVSFDCDKKHQELYRLLKKAGIKVRLRICIFLWSDLDIPSYILNIPHIDRCEHLFVEAFLNKQWITLDASWDIGLRNVLNVNTWDGESNTDLSVKPIKILKPQKNTKLTNSLTKENFEKDMRESGEFYKELNKWLENERVKIH